MEEDSKACSKCGEIKILDDFAKNCKMKDGYLNICAVCNKKRAKSYRVITKIQKEENPIQKLKKEYTQYQSELSLDLNQENDLRKKFDSMVEIYQKIHGGHPSENTNETEDINDLAINSETDQDESGAIYIISNEDMIEKHKYKVGMHTGSQQKLLARYGTALISPIIVYFKRVKDVRNVEKRVLQLLDSSRIVNENDHKTEWIQTSDLFIINAIHEAVENF